MHAEYFELMNRIEKEIIHTNMLIEMLEAQADKVEQFEAKAADLAAKIMEDFEKEIRKESNETTKKKKFTKKKNCRSKVH